MTEELAQKLKEQCKYGEETNPRESAKLLHQLGLVYKEKSPDKISLIQRVALMTSAILREPDNVEEIKKNLTDLCLHILTLANAANLDTLLVDDAVKQAKLKIKELRKTTTHNLASRQPIDDKLNKEDLSKEWQRRVKYVREVQSYVTDQYTGIMGLIADYTSTIMGEAPCKFALVGMGSLARNEVTPYSDFEHIIVLEEGIQLKHYYENVLEYFRWFATVFQMILVRLGETILPFLEIPFLNNQTNYWFYDKYTPCGICPDGFAPHASKNPLGRQTKTEKKPWITELIKPVSEMVKYLDTEEDLKNGYCLADVLTKTCFVYGCKNLHELFDEKVSKKINERVTLVEKQREKVQGYLEQFALLDYKVSGKIDIKRYVYRSSSLFVQALATYYLHDNKSKSCFEVIDELFKQQKIDKTTYGEYQFSLAIACEMRLRAYSTASAQDDIRHMTKIIGLPSCIEDFGADIGKRAIVDSLSIAAALQEHVENCLELEHIHKMPKHDPHQTQIMIAHHLGLSKLAAEMVKEIVPQLEVCETMFLFLCIGALHDGEEYSFCLDLVEENLPITTTTGSSKELACSLYLFGGQCLMRLSRHTEALNYLETAADCTQGNQLNFYVDINIGECYYNQGNLEKALEKFQQAYNATINKKVDGKDSTYYTRLLHLYCNCLIRLKKYANVQEIAEKVLEQRMKLHVKPESDPPTMYALINLGTSLCEQNKYKEALACFDKALNCQYVQTALIQKGKFSFFSRKIQCLIQLGMVLEASMWVNQHFIESSFTNLEEMDIEMIIANLTGLSHNLQLQNNQNAALGHLKQAERLLLLTKNCAKILSEKERNLTHANHFALYHRFAMVLYDEELFKDGLRKAKCAHNIVFYNQWSPQAIVQVKAALPLVMGLFACSNYKDCYSAAKHAIRVCQSVCDNCRTDEFLRIVRVYAKCEDELGIIATLPHENAPSVFFNIL